MPAIEDIDPEGDLVLHVGAEFGYVPRPARFRVSRVALRLASPVWKVMFTGKFAEATAEEVTLPEDSSAGVRILLLIAHLQFKKVPKYPTYPSL